MHSGVIVAFKLPGLQRKRTAHFIERTIVNAVNTWGHHWAKQRISFHCDSKAFVDIWHKGSTHDPQTMALVPLLYFCAAHYNINAVITHICTWFGNCIADSLSHVQEDQF